MSGKSQLPRITTAIPGPKSKEIFGREERYIAPGRQRISLLAGVTLDHGEGATLTDADGNVYLDFFAGVGGRQPRPCSSRDGRQAIGRQAKRLMVGTFATPERAEAFRVALQGRVRADSSARIFTAAGPKRSRRRCDWRVPLRIKARS